MDTVKSSNETSIYIIDDNYRIVHFNSALRDKFPELQCGDICYEKLCQEAKPCARCPFEREDDEAVVFYNKVVQKWLEVGTGRIDWPGMGTCNMVLVREIHEGNKNLFYSLTNISVYDELFELDFTRDSYRLLYHAEDKYVIPGVEGNLGRMLEEMAGAMIHPEDRDSFREFWNRERIRGCLDHGRDEKALKGQFRRLRLEGGYTWVSQVVVPLKRGSGDDDTVMCFIQDISEQKSHEDEIKKALETKDAEFDPMTGLFRRTVFLKRAQEFLSGKTGTYCLAAVDIEHFKLFNEWYGQEEGDRLLSRIGCHLKEIEAAYKGIAGYMGGDDFVIIIPDHRAAIGELQDRIMTYVRQSGGTAGFLPAFGIYGIEDMSMSISTMYDRACIALASVKGSYARRMCRYDSRMMREMEENHKLLSEVQKGLDHGEFVFYAQPKCCLDTGRIVGLEALVRWNHPVRGLIPPGVFLPLLENNGLITKLDLFIWEEVCRKLRRWIDRGHRPVPISVNVSRMDIYAVDVTAVFKELTERYAIEPRLLEVEITESAYVEEYNVIPGVVESLRERLRLLLAHVPEDFVLVSCHDGRFEHEIIADGLARTMGYSREGYLELLEAGGYLKERKGDGYGELLREIREMSGKGGSFVHISPFVCRDGRRMWVRTEAMSVEHTRNETIYLFNYKDVTGIQEKKLELDLLGRKQESILRLADINSWEWNLRQDTLVLTNVTNSNFIKYFCGRGVEVGKVFPNLSHGLKNLSCIPQEYRQAFHEYNKRLRMNQDGGTLILEFPVIAKDNSRVWFRTAAQTLVDENKIPAVVVGYTTDITETRLQSQMLTRMASTDPLTGLLNRQSAIPAIQAYLTKGTQAPGALIMFDLDNFKLANDVFGHDFGDAMIVQNARKLKSYFRSDDIVCRIGGDEFIVLCKNISEKDVEAKLNRIVDEMSTTRHGGGRDIVFSISAGYVMVPEQGTDFDGLYHKADVALFAAKMYSKCTFRKYDASMKTIRIELAK